MLSSACCFRGGKKLKKLLLPHAKTTTLFCGAAMFSESIYSASLKSYGPGAYNLNDISSSPQFYTITRQISLDSYKWLLITSRFKLQVTGYSCGFQCLSAPSLRPCFKPLVILILVLLVFLGDTVKFRFTCPMAGIDCRRLGFTYG